jgi:hypothetical protein
MYIGITDVIEDGNAGLYKLMLLQKVYRSCNCSIIVLVGASHFTQFTGEGGWIACLLEHLLEIVRQSVRALQHATDQAVGQERDLLSGSRRGDCE